MNKMIMIFPVLLLLSCSDEEGQESAVTSSNSTTKTQKDKDDSSTNATDTEEETTDSEEGADLGTEMLTFSGEQSFKIFKYEAKLQDGKAKSAAGVVPTVSIDFDNAKAACESEGLRICTYKEWVLACKGPESLKFGFSDTHEGDTSLSERCDVARSTNNTPGSMPSKTGSHPQCVTTGFEVYDMIGNATEWTVDAEGTPVAAGVAFYQTEENSYCETTLTGGGQTMDPSTESTDLGFRCCGD